MGVAPILPVLISLPGMCLCGTSAAFLWPGVAELEMFSQGQKVYGILGMTKHEDRSLCFWWRGWTIVTNLAMLTTGLIFMRRDVFIAVAAIFWAQWEGVGPTTKLPLPSLHVSLEGIPWPLPMVLGRKHLQFCYSSIFLLSSQSQAPFHQYSSPFLFLKIFSSFSFIAWASHPRSSPLLTSSIFTPALWKYLPSLKCSTAFESAWALFSWHHSAWLVPTSHQRHGPGEYSVPLEVPGLWPPEIWGPG